MPPYMPLDPVTAQSAVLGWYDRHRRSLPWRATNGPGDAYGVWLSEIMLQQTTVAAVVPYYEEFTRRWPDVHALGAADLDDVLRQWAGLGYYARARNLHKCARHVSLKLGGVFPRDEKSLLALPGIGPYTAAAIGAIAFNQPCVAVDGNIERVVARLYAIETPLPAAKPDIRIHAAKLAEDVKRPGDYTQALMDLGASICTPRSPKCGICPLRDMCAARAAGIQDALPARLKKKKNPVSKGVACWIEDGAGHVMLRRRPSEGLLGGMMEFPSSGWSSSRSDQSVAAALPGSLSGQVALEIIPGVVRHVFTHFTLELAVHHGRADRALVPETSQIRWVRIENAPDEALPGLMMKVYRHCLQHKAEQGI